MQRLFIVWAMAGLLVSCGNNETGTGEKADTMAGHSGGQVQPVEVKTGASGKSMMQIMQANMDQMKATPSSGNPDNDFAALMKIHHLGALEMAAEELAAGTDAEIKRMAQKMTDDQQKEIAELNSFLTGHKAHGGGDAFYQKVMWQMKDMKMEMDHAGSTDKQFVQMMIPHHQGAIDMAKAYLATGAHEAKLKSMANNIIVSQQKEMDQLREWLAKH